jgi:hypothetical protein
MSKPDTSREAVEMRAQQHDGTSAIVPGLLGAWCRETADLLRALVDERDYWMQNSATAWDTCEQRRLQAAQASLERDALRAALCAASLDRLAANDAPLLDLEAAYKAGAEAMRRAAMAACVLAGPPAHTYASENAEIYRAQDTMRDRCVDAIRALPLPKMEDKTND